MPLDAEARAIFEEHFNCAQSVLVPFADRFGLDREIAFKISTAFGGGMGHSGQTCGAVCGALMVIGLAQGTAVVDRPKKYECYGLASTFLARFQAQRGALTCPALLGLNIGNPAELEQARAQNLFHTLCPDLVGDAVLIVVELLGLEP